MHKPYDTYELLTEQDYGPWLDRLSLLEFKGKFYLQEEYGYSKPYDRRWYELSAKPEATLASAFGDSKTGLLCGNGDSSDFEVLGVSLTRCEAPA